MGYVAKKVSKPKPPPPAGVHPARLVWLIKFGTQLVKGYKGAPDELKEQVHLFFEMPTITHVFNEEKGPQPFGVSKTFTLSLDEKANLSKFLEEWFGRKLTEKERAEGYDLEQLVGKTCLLTIVHAPDQNDKNKIYGNISKIEKNADVKVGEEIIKKKFNLQPAVNPIIKFDLDSNNWATEMEKLPKWAQTKVKASEEWKAMDHAPTQPTNYPAAETADDSDEF